MPNATFCRKTDSIVFDELSDSGLMAILRVSIGCLNDYCFYQVIYIFSIQWTIKWPDPKGLTYSSQIKVGWNRNEKWWNL